MQFIFQKTPFMNSVYLYMPVTSFLRSRPSFFLSVENSSV